jgi:hypothetical protein
VLSILLLAVVLSVLLPFMASDIFKLSLTITV